MTTEHLITDHMEAWTGAVLDKKSAGRGGGSKRELLGIGKLRELIFELATHGLLVSKNPKDGSTQALRTKIAAEEYKLDATGQIRHH